MLETPKHGWSKITIGNWSDRCSYLDDVPFKLLNAIKKLYEGHEPVSVRFDAEGWEYIVVFDWHCTHIISESTDEECMNTFNYLFIEVNRDDIAKELISDICRDIDEWSKWLSYCDMPEEMILGRKNELLLLCEKIEKML